MLVLTPKERVRRRPVWIALSELFLDTEVRPRIVEAAYACLQSGYSKEVLEHIWKHEISPVLAPNLLSIAGEWALFDPDLLEKNILGRKKGFLDGVAARINASCWSEVLRLMYWLQDWPEPRREPVVRVLERFVSLALDDRFGAAVPNEELDKAQRMRIWEEGAKVLLIAQHVKGFDPPLDDILRRGYSLVKR